MRCKRCVLPEYKSDIWLNEDGICNICIDFEKRKTLKQDTMLLESDFIKILNKYKGRSKYDCLVMCSGGKDSTMSLYYMKKRYKTNPLAFTFDHGFENDEALENIRNAVNILGVDWFYHKTNFMKDIFARIVRTGSKATICHVCAIWYLKLTFDFAARYKIPLIVAGWTKGQSLEMGESGKEYTSMSKATVDFVENCLRCAPEYKEFPRSTEEAIGIARKKLKFKSILISPHWYLPDDKDKMIEILQKELKWKAPRLSYPRGSTNCLMNFVNVYLSMKHYGYTNYHIEMSKLIRLGEISREEALEMLKINFDDKLVDTILKKIGCNLERPIK